MYKKKYWREYYLAKCIEKHFGEINIGDLGKMQQNMTRVHYYCIGDFNSPIAKVYSSPIFHLIRYITISPLIN